MGGRGGKGFGRGLRVKRVLRINTEATAPLPPLSRTPHSDAASRRRTRLRLRPRRQRLRLVPSLLQHQARATMEHGSLEDSSASTFSIMEEDHTLANSVRFVLNQDPRVAFCGYSIPHPSENKVNIRLQTTGDPAKDVLKDSLQDLMVMCQHIRGTFDTAVADFRGNKPADAMDIDLNKK
ncbi:DNA-directed RNA polymerases I and III subunit RPAC2-like isoform X2 [Panicum virgatum]|uniref:DNA-directed RNA polymerases I and III subunit RPAC2-like isoform X2 n=1 Tax=Panicum virgatum TaxID=38727 RepID=UPI0019D528B3|nr:DNA-directed RNA polymerases I and III subunit RPAC2-like isoform X2 [Panicum virgatum]